jgi:hypothetical protein
MRIKPQSTGLDGEPGECFGGHFANLRGHSVDKAKRLILGFDRGFDARFGSQLLPKLKISAYR